MTKKAGQKSRGYFGIGVYHPKTSENIGTLWREAKLFGADFIFTIGRRFPKQCSDTLKTYRHIPLWEFETLEELKKHKPVDCRLVCVELTDEAKPLNSYSHPERAIYLLGAEDYGIPKELLNEWDETILIPQANMVSSSNVAVSGSIVMYDRFVKRGLNH